jgi:hypothetical protein
VSGPELGMPELPGDGEAGYLDALLITDAALRGDLALLGSLTMQSGDDPGPVLHALAGMVISAIGQDRADPRQVIPLMLAAERERRSGG